MIYDLRYSKELVASGLTLTRRKISISTLSMGTTLGLAGVACLFFRMGAAWAKKLV
jgi:hypothetical protein